MENSEPKTCPVLMHGGKPCGRRPYYGDKCRCHSEKEDKNVEPFQQELDKIFADEKAEYYDLTGFYFPKTGYKLPREYAKDVYFSAAGFSGTVDFVLAAFLGAAVFNRATFSGVAHFIGAEFSGAANFSEAVFSGEADFIEAEFSGAADFSLAKFSGAANFDAEGNKDRMFLDEANLTTCSLLLPEKIKFRKVSLANCRFLETDMSQVQFIDVTWAKKPKFVKWLPRRKAVHDEVSISDNWFKWLRCKIKREKEPPKPEYNLIAQLYRHLQANYINNYRYTEASDFYVGEQEMMRKAKGSGWMVWRRWVCTNFVYKWISYYGESFILPLAWLAVTLFGSALYLLLDGINPSSSPSGAEINYDLCAEGEFFLLNSAYWQVFVRNLSFVTFNRADVSRSLPEWYQLGIVTLENIVVVVLVTFFVLALRRRYKRKGF